MTLFGILGSYVICPPPAPDAINAACKAQTAASFSWSKHGYGADLTTSPNPCQAPDLSASGTPTWFTSQGKTSDSRSGRKVVTIQPAPLPDSVSLDLTCIPNMYASSSSGLTNISTSAFGLPFRAPWNAFASCIIRGRVRMNVASSSFLAAVFSFVRSAISESAIVWRWREKTNTPASETNSPSKPATTMMIKTSLGHANHRGSFPCSSRYSPTAPMVRISPPPTRMISDTSSRVSVADFDSENNDKKYPISAYDLVGALGFVLQGIGLACILYHRLHRRHK